MRIKFSPQRRDDQLSVTRAGDALTFNGVKFDFGNLPLGATLPAGAADCPWIFGDIEKTAEGVQVTILLPHAADAPESARFPRDIVNPADGQILLPGTTAQVYASSVPGVIDWSRMITAEMKAEADAARHLAAVVADTAQRRVAADSAIAPLQDAVDLDEATEPEAALLKEWKRYRVALNRLPEQPGYPTEIDWPAPPA